MIRFISRILMISTFFIGIGAITDKAWKTVSSNNSECKKVIKIDPDVSFDTPPEKLKIIIIQRN